MFQAQVIFGWIVFTLGAGAYLPLAIGGWQHPAEINTASYSIWLIISGMLLWSSRKQGFSGWRMPLGFFVGNALLLATGLIRGGHTFNLGATETTALFGIVGTVSLWVTIGTLTRRWSSRIIFLGGVIADVLSFYPQIKQYMLPHEPPTDLFFLGWILWLASALVNIILVERLPRRLADVVFSTSQDKHASIWAIIEASLFSIENAVLMTITLRIMTQN